ncbi:MAG: hypothetical protein ACMXX5_00480 [Candidatus Woesearchaeota archaeon]
MNGKIKNTISKKLMILFGAILLILTVACAPVEPQPEIEQFPEEQQQQIDILDETQIQEPELPEIVGVVNGREITREEVMDVQIQMMMQGMQSDIEESISQVIIYKLLVEEAENRGIQFTNEEVEELIIEQEPYLTNTDELREIIEMEGMDYQAFLDQQKNNLMVAALVDDEKDNIVIEEEQVIQFYEMQADALDQTYDEVAEDLRNFLKEQEASNMISMLANELMEEAVIELFY